MQVMLDEFQDTLKWYHPQFEGSGGFDLRCKPNSQELELHLFLRHKIMSQVDKYIYTYICPLQSNLKCGNDDEMDWVMKLTITYSYVFT